MKQFLSTLTLSLFLSSVTFASFPVKVSSNEGENSTVAAGTKNQKTSTVSAKETAVKSQSQVKPTKKIDKVQAKAEKKEAKSEKNSTVAIILALVSVLLLPFGLHNWYLGRKKQALWQTLLVVPGFILLVPPLISWIWQIVDLIRLIANGELPS